MNGASQSNAIGSLGSTQPNGFSLNKAPTNRARISIRQAANGYILSEENYDIGRYVDERIVNTLDELPDILREMFTAPHAQTLPPVSGGVTRAAQNTEARNTDLRVEMADRSD